jgi:DnaK suppressor protein
MLPSIMAGRSKIDLKTQRTWLETRREELVQRASMTKGARDPVELDQSRVGRLSRMDALQGQAMAQETERRRNIELQRIDAALARLDTDDYGYCLTCGEEISRKRIELDPAAAVCIDCASAA